MMVSDTMKHTSLKTPLVGDLVDFRLDGHWDGRGRLCGQPQGYEGSMEVQLIKPCKEYLAGERILISLDELIPLIPTGPLTMPE